MDAQLRIANRDSETDPLEALALAERAGEKLPEIRCGREFTLKPQWPRQIRRLALDLRMIRSDFVLTFPAFQYWSVNAYNCDTYCTCEENDCEDCQPGRADCCGACFTVHCSDCSEEIASPGTLGETRWVYQYSWLATGPTCESCALRDLTYQEWAGI